MISKLKLGKYFWHLVLKTETVFHFHMLLIYYLTVLYCLYNISLCICCYYERRDMYTFYSIHAISHTVRSHRIWPIRKPNSHKIFKSHRFFRQSYNTFYEEINIHHTLLCLSETSYMYNKGFRLFWGSFKVIFVKISQNFIKSHLKICLISKISVHSLWHVCYSYIYVLMNMEDF